MQQMQSLKLQGSTDKNISFKIFRVGRGHLLSLTQSMCKDKVRVF